jgi:hypothetical protein
MNSASAMQQPSRSPSSSLTSAYQSRALIHVFATMAMNTDKEEQQHERVVESPASPSRTGSVLVDSAVVPAAGSREC